MRAYYNENDPGAAEWLRELIRAGLITDGDVDERSIVDVRPEDVRGYRRVHLFAGIGGWERALRLAGLPEDRRIWTGSCPCQPFSDAGEQKGEQDDRHLWPWMHNLVEIERHPEILGEQVASKLGREWLAGVRADLEELGYEVGAADLCAAGVAAPHIRQRLFWVANSRSSERGWRNQSSGEHRGALHASNRCELGGMADAELQRARGGGERIEGQAECGRDRPAIDSQTLRLANSKIGGQPELRDEALARNSGHVDGGGIVGGLGASVEPRLERHAGNGDDGHQPGWQHADATGSVASASTVGFWNRFDLIPCRDGKTRRVESGTFPLAYGIPARVGRLRGYGNAIVPQVAAEFIRAYLESEGR